MLFSTSDSSFKLLGDGYMPSWSNDSTKLYSGNTDDGSIMQLDIDSASLVGDLFTEVFCADGIDQFAQVSPDASMNATTGECRKMLHGSLTNPRFSGDGLKLSVDDRSKNQVHVFDLTGFELP